MEVSRDKAKVNRQLCFGCGLCATSCKPGAIEMTERSRLRGIKELY